MSASAGVRLGVVVLALAGALGLAWLEGGAWGLLALPVAVVALGGRGVRVGAGWALFVATLAVLDGASVAVTSRSLGVHLVRARAEALRVGDAGQDVRTTDCERYAYRTTAFSPPGSVRNADGHAVYTVDGEDPVRVLLLGDSILDGHLAPALRRRFQAQGRGAVIVDASMAGYDWTDVACAAGRALEAQAFDVTFVATCINDLPIELGVDLDLGGGLARFEITSFVRADLSADLPPLLLDSAHPWVAAHMGELQRRFGGVLKTDVAGTALLAGSLAELQAAGPAAVDALLRPLDDRAGTVVVVPFPLAYDVTPDPVAPLVAWQVAAFGDRGVAVFDPTDTLRAIPLAQRLWEGDGTPGSLVQGRHDLVHYREGALEAVWAGAMGQDGR